MGGMAEKIIRTVRHPSRLYVAAAKLGLTNGVSDEEHLKRMYKILMGRPLDVDNPKTLNEKLQWLKLHDRNPLYTTLVDKLAVKDWAAEKVGPEYVTPTYAVWDSAEDIDIEDLPRSFVLKCNHDSGSAVICRDKETFDLASAQRSLDAHLKKSWYWHSREWPYKDVKPLVFAEQYLDPASTGEETDCSGDEVAGPSDVISDYKFSCFDGEPKFLYVKQRYGNKGCISYFGMDWRPAPFKRLDFPPLPALPPRPRCFDEMTRLARILAKGIPFVRVDFLEYEGRPRFSEMTFYPDSGFTPYDPEEYDRIMGDLLRLPR